MKISKTQIAIIIAACILLAMIIVSLGTPRPKATAPKAESKAAEQALPQTGRYILPPAAGRYELPPAAGTDASPVTQSEAATIKQLPPEKIHKRTASPGAEKEQAEADKGYDSVVPSLPPQPQILPPPDKMKEMQQQGIVLF